MQPARQRVLFANGSRSSRQDEEYRLEGILGVLGLPEESPTQSQHHRAVPAYQFLKGRLVAASHKSLQQFRVGRRLVRRNSGPTAKLAKDTTERNMRHERASAQ